jgi:transposase
MAMYPLSGAMFVFFNRRRTLIKLLIWDTTGFAIYYKRLSRGTFGQFDHDSTRSYHGITRDELLCVLEGIELKTVQKRKRYFHQTHGYKSNCFGCFLSRIIVDYFTLKCLILRGAFA